MNLARSGLKLFIARTAASAISFLGVVYFARELGSSQLGVFFLFQAVLGLLSIPADFGIREAVAKRLSESDQRGGIVSTAIILKSALLCVLICGILLFRGPINSYLGADLAAYIIFALIASEFAFLTMSVLQGEMRIGETALPKISNKIIFVCLGMFFVAQGYKVVGVVYSFSIGFIAVIAIGVYRSEVSLNKPSISNAKSILNYSRFAFISTLGGYFHGWMDVAIIGLFLSQSSVGIYEVSWRVTVIVTLFSKAISKTIFPQVSQWDAEGAKNKIEQLLPKVIGPVLLLVIPAFIGTLILSEEILQIIFGEEYVAGKLVLMILMAEKVIQSVHLVFAKCLQGINRADLAAKSSAISVGLNLILNLLLIPNFGILGAAIATTLSFVTNSALHAFYLSRFVSISFPISEIRSSIAVSAVMGLVLFLIKSYLLIDDIIYLAAIILFGVLIYSVISLFVPVLRRTILLNLRRIVA